MRARVCGEFAPFTEVNGVKTELLSALLPNVDDLSTLGSDKNVDNVELINVNFNLRNHPIEIVGAELRDAMTSMKQIALGE